MSKLRVNSFAISLDGYGAGPSQDLDNPLGVGGGALHEWALGTRTFRQMFGSDGGTTGADDDFAARGFANIGAWIVGRNMFGAVRGPWPDDSSKGWWGDNPPYHVPVFVLTHHPRASIPMDGGTTFHFVTGGIHEALKRATEAANGRDIRLGGGLRRSGSTSGRGWSMRCIWPSRPSFSAPVSTASPALTRRSSVIGAPSMWPHRAPRMSSSAKRPDGG